MGPQCAHSVATSIGSCHPPSPPGLYLLTDTPLRTGGFHHLPELAGRPQGFWSISRTTPLPCASPRLWGQCAVSAIPSLEGPHWETEGISELLRRTQMCHLRGYRTVSNQELSLVNKEDIQVNKRAATYTTTSSSFYPIPCYLSSAWASLIYDPLSPSPLLST